jgi:PAS domain S-box-containing protein
MSLALIDPGSAYATGLVLLAGVFAAGAAIHGFAARHRERRSDHATLAIVCGTVTVYLVLQVCLYRSHSPDVHGSLRRCEQFSVAPFMVAYALYLAGLAKLPRLVVGTVAIVVSVIAVAAAAASPAGLWLARVERLQEFALPWGETLMLARGPASPWMLYSLISWLLLCCFGVWCALRHRRHPGAVGVPALLVANVFFFVALVHDSLLDAGVVRGVFLSEFVSPAIAGAMWWRVAAAHQRHVESTRRLFARAGDAILVHDAVTGRVVEANEAACGMFAMSREELVARGGLALVLPELRGDPAAIARVVAESSVAGASVVERALRRRDGVEFPAEIALRATAIAGRLQLVASLRDLTPRRRAEQALVENEHRLRQVIERCPIAVAETERDGRALTLNPSFAELFGYGVDELDSFSAWGRLAEPDAPERERTLERWARAMAEARAGDGTIPSFRAPMRDRRGGTRHVDISCLIVGERLATFITDLTDVVAAREALAEQEALNRAILEEAADGVVLAWRHPAGGSGITLWNRRMAEIAGRDMTRANAEGWLSLLPDAGEARDVELEIERPDGTRRTCLLSASRVPVPELDAGPRGARWTLTLIRDITEQRRAEEERRQLEAQAQSAQQLEGLGVLAGGIAHDFNNLLMAILGRIGLVGATVAADDAASRDDLAEMDAAARRAALLCQQMLAYAGRGGARIEPVDLCLLVQDMSAMLAIPLAKRASLERDYAAPSVVVNADAGQIRQLVMNLVTNAAEAMGEQGGAVRLRLGLTELRSPHAAAAGIMLPAGGYAVIEIADSGPGMDAGTLQRVFEPFFTTKFTGRGLGLAVVLGIVRSHRGGIDIDSAPGRGTTVRVLIPALHAIAAPPERAPARGGGRGSVLVVEDEGAIRAITAEMLVHLGYETREAATAREALLAFADGPTRPLAVVLDLSLPDGNGEEVARRLRALDPRVRIIVASGYGRDEIRRYAGDLAPDAMLTKPYGIGELSRALAAGGAP